jgi:hypothetical protein
MEALDDAGEPDGVEELDKAKELDEPGGCNEVEDLDELE